MKQPYFYWKFTMFKFWILVQGLTSVAGGMNTIWFFEKEADNMNDNTPKYEGIIVDYDQKISVSESNNNQDTNISNIMVSLS